MNTEAVKIYNTHGRLKCKLCEHRVHLMTPEACFKIFSKFCILNAFAFLTIPNSIGDN
jgi:hypothetical protein